MSVASIQTSVPVFRPSEKPPLCDIVQEIALKVLKELALSIVFGSIVSLFVVSASGTTFLISAVVVQLAVSTFFHSLGAFATYQALDKDPHQGFYQNIAYACEWIAGLNFAVLTGFNTQTVVHESGHALASLLLYKNPRPNIAVYPFAGGITEFYKTKLTPWGQKLGSAASTCFVVASGPGLALLVSSAIWAIGMALLDKYPQFGKYLISWAAIDFLHHAAYAYSALGAKPWNLTHDFVHLAIFGLNPVAASIGILAIPVLITLGMMNFRKTEPPTGIAAALA